MNIIKRYIVWIVVAIFLAAMIGYSITYTVRFTESAVVTRFGKAVVGENDSNPMGEPGLHFKWFYPIDSVTKYDTRMRFFQARSETQQTADSFQIVIEGFATYRVSDPLKFYRSFSAQGSRAIDHFNAAEEMLRSRLRSSLSETSRYKMAELFDPTVGGSKLGELEASVLALTNGGGGDETQRGSSGPLSQYGIEVTMVGIDRVVLPEVTTQEVMNRMSVNRVRLAQEYTSEGAARAQTIVAKANADAQRIRAFSESRAQEIIAQGETEAAKYLAMQDSHPELAVFLQQLALMREVYARKVTLVLSTNTFGLQYFNPAVAQYLRRGEFVPGDVEAGDASASVDGEQQP